MPARKPAPPTRPAHLPWGRWLGDLEAEAPLSEAEKALVACCARGESWRPEGWDGQRPTDASDENTIRARLVRFLMLGGDQLNPVHEEGVMVRGGWIAGELSLHQAFCSVQLDLMHCHIAEQPYLTAAHLPELAFIGSSLPGLHADRIVVKGGVYLRDGFRANGTVRLLNGKIGGNLDCCGSEFFQSGGVALGADGLTVGGDVFFRDGFAARGVVRLPGAVVGGDLSCTRGQFSNDGNEALIAANTSVRGNLFMRDVSLDAVNLSDARIGTLVDDETCWEHGGHILDGFRYDRIGGTTSVSERVKWLHSQRADQLDQRNFAPQPWEQLVKVLREMGHPHEASEVAMAKQRALRKAGKITGLVRNVMHWFYGLLAGYGYRPIWTVYWMLAVWLVCAIAFYAGRDNGYFGPANPLIHAAPALEVCGAPGEGKPFWTSKQCPTPPEYTTLQPALYSLDLLLPLVELQQDRDWSPIVVDADSKQLWPGHALRLLMWFEILFGWAASLILVAVLGRLVEKD